MVNIYAGNLAYGLTEDELREAFERFGAVERVSVIIDRLTGRSRGFGFVEMANADEAKAAIAGLHDVDLKGRKLLVREAEPRQARPPRERRDRPDRM